METELEEDEITNLFNKIKNSKEPIIITINGDNFCYEPSIGKFFRLRNCYIDNIGEIKQITSAIMESHEGKYRIQ